MRIYYHICNNFIGNKIHSEVISRFAISDPNSKHYIFIPFVKRKLFQVNRFDLENVFIEYIYVPKFLRFFPIFKSIFIASRILLRAKKYNIDWSLGNCLGYTFWSDGVICLYIKLLFNTPFITFIRATDVSIFLRYGFHLRPLFKLIEKKSSALCFPSKVLKDSFYNSLFLNSNRNKGLFMPNPLNDFWFDNIYYFDNLKIKNKNVIFVGSFDKNKNLKAVFNGCAILNEVRQDFTLEFIGGSIQDFRKICEVDVIPSWVKVTRRLTKQELLIKYRKSNILIVPSFVETFGMVYLEALSQGCLVIHSEGQGIDNIFKNKVYSYSVNPNNYIQVSNTIDDLLDLDFKKSEEEVRELLKPFSSQKIIRKYNSLFI